MCRDFNYIIDISSSILFTEKRREKMHADRMAQTAQAGRVD
jgi:hypothetical protein